MRLLGLALLLTTQACTQNSFSLTEKSKSSQAIGLDPDTKASDRPTESGTGVPGYLVECSPFNVQDDNVQVGCMTTTADGVRVLNTPDSWNRYDIRLPADSPYGVTIDKTVASNLADWDVNFTFRGADKITLTSVARNSIYGFTYQNAAGQNVRIETAPLPPPKPVEAPAAPTTSTAPTCLGGSFVDGVCFVPVESSCTEYCSRAGLAPHPYITSKFGNGEDLDTDANEQACHDLFVKIRGTADFRFGDTNGRGIGCFEEANGRVVFDQEDTNPAAYPRIGDRRICGCL
ncbi:hypothetical protein [Oligoflexus tunisiensis]|uniref:hypothetical protein n=1 Tax=Oligoflexus tunisiensis TaxID=708132 RepID=UPI001C402FCD|nr:hypothetical protein [Oligoflexus tunisiensis]